MPPCDVRHFLGPCLLLLLHERADHGYDLLERLRPFHGWDVEAPTVYRSLRSLERQGLVHSHWVPSDCGPARRRYEITPTGCSALAVAARDLRSLRETLDRFLFRQSRAWQSASRPSPARLR